VIQSSFDMVSKAGFSMARTPMAEKIFSNHLNLKAFVTIAQDLGARSGKWQECLNVAHFHHFTKMCFAA